ncbi:hypothetical protein [Streptomyces prasinus]|uniref:hypothetical protein n=1 Tax=Streptomyces prasinus TaxID=67345 RepID=UPI0011476FB8|nr:hypothetical protein [Streptomyces prasinus]
MLQLGHRLRFFRFALGFVPTRFAACGESDGPALEHALADDATLCGIPRHQVTVYRHLFLARKFGNCSECRVKAFEASSRP